MAFEMAKRGARRDWNDYLGPNTIRYFESFGPPPYDSKRLQW